MKAAHSVGVASVGAVTPAGVGIPATWAGLLRPSVSGEVVAPATEGIPALAVCRAPVTDADHVLERHERRRLGRSHELAAIAADEAMSAVADRPVDPTRFAVVVGIGFGAMDLIQSGLTALATAGPRSISPYLLPAAMPSSVTGHLSLRYQAQGPCLTVTTACASGADAIRLAYEMIHAGTVDRVLAGGVDALANGTVALLFERLGALAPARPGQPPMRPFDAERDGLALSEGAAFIVLESSRIADGIPLVGVVAGCHANSDGHHVVAPRPDGAMIEACMIGAMRRANVVGADLAHVNAHGSATPANDLIESAAIYRVLGDAVPVWAPKGATGHMLGASGAFEVVASLLALRHGTVPPTHGFRKRAPDIPLMPTARPESRTERFALTNSFAFGGSNCSIVVCRPEDGDG